MEKVAENIKEALRRIRIAKTKEAKSLDLSALELNELPGEFFELSATLLELNVSNNRLGDKGMMQLADAFPQLQKLNIEGNQITSIGGQYVIGFPNITLLNISNNQLTLANAEHINALENLVSLDLSSNAIETELDDYIFSKSKAKLLELRISGNIISPTAASSILAYCPNLITLSVSNCRIKYDFINQSGIMFLPGKLKQLDISRNELRDSHIIAIGDYLRELTYLNLGKTNATNKSIISISGKLSKLSHLSLWSNDLSDESIITVAKNLPNLQTLDIDDNNVTSKGLYALYKAYSTKENFNLYFAHNSSDLPSSAITDWQTLKEYFRSIETVDDRITVNALNVLLLGNTTAGKSSLLEYYLKGTFKEGKDSTFGISHTSETVNINGDKTEISFWDFGGQEYFHGTHRLFMGTRNALYLLLWESKYEDGLTRKNEKDDDCFPFRYWLGTVRHFSNGDYQTGNDMYQRALLVQSKTDKPEAKLLYPAEAFTDMNGRFGLPANNIFSVSVKAAAAKDARAGLYWQLFRLRFEELVQQYKAGYRFNKYIIGIRNEALHEWRRENKLYLSREEFQKRCVAYYDEAHRYMELIPQYLEDSGEIIRFAVPQLRDKIFIDPQKLLAKIYDVLNDKVQQQGGRFTKAAIAAKEKDVLLEILLHMELVFPDPQCKEEDDAKKEYIAPQYMQEDHASALLKHLRGLLKPSFSLRFPDFMPRAYITQFIARKGSDAAEGVFWKFGVLYTYTDGHSCRVLVEADPESRFIQVYAEDSPVKYKAVKEVFDFFAFYERDKAMEKTKTAENPPAEAEIMKRQEKQGETLPSPFLELSADGKSYAPIGEILKAAGARTAKVKNTEGNYMPVDSIFHVLLNKTDITPKKVFFSYAHNDKPYRDEFERHFSALKREGLIATWHDAMIKPGSDWDASIKAELAQADIVIYMISPSFMQSEYIWQHEVKKFVDQQRKGMFLFLCISPCDYGTLLGGIQLAPHDELQKLTWVGLEDNPAKRDALYLQIIQKLRELMKQIA